MVKKHLTFLLFIIIAILKDSLEVFQGCKAPLRVCPGTNHCVLSLVDCPTLMVCPQNTVKMQLCGQFTCTRSNLNACVTNTCPDTKLSCWNNQCVDNQDFCPTMVTCPTTSASFSVRCHDNSCVANVDDCPKYIDCPFFTPIRCPTGDCRKRLSDCPSITTCPKEFPIKCNDGNCKSTNQECEISAFQTQCPDNSMVRCSDGTCTTAKFLCPTLKTCPINFVLCWDGNCAKELSACKKPSTEQMSSCSVREMVRCETDGSCRMNINQCPTGIICPISKPVKCWDASCKESIGKCPAFQPCPPGSMECPDGTCTNKACGTHITCSNDAPYKCYDNTCKSNPNDCPTMPDCLGESPILCWDGTCVKNRIDCLPQDNCNINESIKCPNNMCKRSIEECKTTTECPLGFIRCPSDGTCKKQLTSCSQDSCTVNFPFKCSNGMCVEKAENCNENNGCPFYATFKCEDGSCAKDSKSCNIINLKNCKENERACPDGSCLPNVMPCPNSNGCPTQYPLLCADGSCIDPKIGAQCHIPICPKETPIRCSQGLCVKTSSNCPNDVTKKDKNNDCPQGLILCDDGLCAKSFSQCNPVFACQNGYERCGDGSCRISADYCPRVKNTCPSSRPFRCNDNGTCVPKSTECINLSGCPSKTPIKCPSNGACVENIYECKNIDMLFPIANGCSISAPFKCANGACVSDSTRCKINLCPPGKVFCENTGTCADDKAACAELGTGCPKGTVKCPDSSCKVDFMSCYNEDNCPMKEPFRCLDGQCNPNPILYLSEKEGTCGSSIVCPTYQPFLCADGSCVEKSSFCTVLFPCPADTPYRCFDRKCVKTSDDCPSQKKCPSTNPILCENGNCATSIFDCDDEVCRDENPYWCITGKCEPYWLSCINSFTATTTPICADNLVQCQDGSCRKSENDCSIFEGCTNPEKPYKCLNGACTKSLDECVSKKYNEPENCPEGKRRCEDGICRIKCFDYNGCPFSQPLQCPNGRCVSLLMECAGISFCSLDFPFECADGSCKKTIYECKRAKKTFVGTDLTIFVYPENNLRAVTILGTSNEILGGIEIPANTFSDEKNNSTFTLLSYSSYPSSKVANTVTKFHETRLLDIRNALPFADKNSNFTLEYDYAVLSPVIEIKNATNVKFNNNILLSLAFDFPINLDNNLMNRKGLNPFKDVCLGYLQDNKYWVCTGTKSQVLKFEGYKLLAGVNKTGIYSVILNPEPDLMELKVVENFLIKYSLIILISSSVAILLFVGGTYAFLRIYRYRGKYKQTKDESEKTANKMVELSNINTSIIGQTLGDNLDNIVFMNNPSYKVEKVELKSNRTVELESLQESIQKKYRVLEGNNEQLKKTHDTLTNELRRLKEYHEQ